MKKQNLRNNKGITLIALIITIVVLLILAVVAIGAAQDSNIVGYAQNAVGKYEEGKGLEHNTIGGYEDILAQYANGGNGIGNSGGNDLGGSNTPVENLGKYVKYDSNGNGSVSDETILWRVLRDDSDKVELITADALGNVDLTPTDFDDARNKYNGAVSTIVAECVRVTGISSVRSIGGPAIDRTTETVDFEELAETTDFNPTVDISEFDKYEGENGLKVEEDQIDGTEQMSKAGVLVADNRQDYWLASRNVIVEDNGTMVRFYLNHVRGDGAQELGGQHCILSVASYGYVSLNSMSLSRGVRPILILDPGVLDNVTQLGTKEQPIEIYQN